VIRNSGFHCGRAANRFVDAAKVVEREPYADSGPVVLPLLAESVREPSKTPRAHANAKILALDNRSTDTFGIRLTYDQDGLHGSNFSGAVAAFPLAGRFVYFDKLREASHAVMERRGNRGTVRSETIRCDLKRCARRRIAEAFNEAIGGSLIALSKCEVENQFGVPFDCDERVGVSKVRIVLRANALLFFADECLELITFHIAHLNVANFFGHDAFAFLASKYQELEDRSVVCASNTPHA
jgi:hypothetical protein